MLGIAVGCVIYRFIFLNYDIYIESDWYHLNFYRLFDLSADLQQPEQEYYLQPVEPGRSRNAASICPVDFSFGGDHLWDRFSVSSVESCGVLWFFMYPSVLGLEGLSYMVWWLQINKHINWKNKAGVNEVSLRYNSLLSILIPFTHPWLILLVHL